MQIAIVTGGSRGLGKNSSLHIAKNGIGVLLTYQNKRAEAEAGSRRDHQNGGKAAALQLDVGRSETFQPSSPKSKPCFATSGRPISLTFSSTTLALAYMPPSRDDRTAFDEVYRIHLKGPYS